MKDIVTTKIANKQLEPIIKFAHANRGTINALQQRLTKRTKKQWRRENIERWLHEDPDKRTQPLLGVGLLLVEIGNEYIAEVNGAAAK